MGARFRRARFTARLAACVTLCAAIVSACGLDVTGTSDEAVEQQPWIRNVHQGRILPSTHWNITQTRQQELLNTQTGKIMHVSVIDAGRETVRTATQVPGATHFAYAGDVQMEQWFDDRARWVKSTFKATTDGSTIEYILQG